MQCSPPIPAWGTSYMFAVERRSRAPWRRATTQKENTSQSRRSQKQSRFRSERSKERWKKNQAMTERSWLGLKLPEANSQAGVLSSAEPRLHRTKSPARQRPAESETQGSNLSLQILKVPQSVEMSQIKETVWTPRHPSGWNARAGAVSDQRSNTSGSHISFTRWPLTSAQYSDLQVLPITFVNRLRGQWGNSATNPRRSSKRKPKRFPTDVPSRSNNCCLSTSQTHHDANNATLRNQKKKPFSLLARFSQTSIVNYQHNSWSEVIDVYLWLFMLLYCLS